MNRVVVAGATGVAGRVVVAHLREEGYDVRGTDLAATHSGGALRADLTDYGQAAEVLRGADAVVHLANFPAPGILTPAATFSANVAMNFNVFRAAPEVGLRRVVWASSEMTLGLPFGIDTSAAPYADVDGQPPRYAPVAEDHYPLPTNTYALSKVASEVIAEHLGRWSGIPFLGLRLSNVLRPDDYATLPGFWPDPQARKFNLWGYVDVRDVAAACRAALEAPGAAATGSTSLIIAAADTVMNRPSRDLLAEVFPGTPLTRDLGEFDTLLAIDRPREVIGYRPAHSWRDHLTER